MKLPFYISKRYLFSKKSTNVINIISGISLTGTALVTASLIVILSVFNGLFSIVEDTYGSFDSDLKITSKQGKVFSTDIAAFDSIKKLEAVANYVETIEETALFEYNKKQYIGTLKGVTDNYTQNNRLDTMLFDGEFIIKRRNEPMAVVGYGIASVLQIGVDNLEPLKIWTARRNERLNFNAIEAFNRDILFISGIFMAQADYSFKYVITDIDFAREILEYSPHTASSIEIKVAENYNIEKTKNTIKNILGTNFKVQNKYEQHESLFKIMKSEKWAIYLIIGFILLIVSFNSVGSTAMLIIEKEKDINTLKFIGADRRTIELIFFYESWLISIIGTVIGILLGLIICFAQIKYGFVTLPSTQTIMLEAYPVEIKIFDIIFSFIIVITIGFIASYIPVKYFLQKNFRENN